MGLTTRSCRLGGTTSARMKRWQLSRSTVVCVIGLPAFADGPALSRKRSRTPPSHCLPPTTSIEQRQNSPCHWLLNTLMLQPNFRHVADWKRLPETVFEDLAARIAGGVIREQPRSEENVIRATVAPIIARRSARSRRAT